MKMFGPVYDCQVCGIVYGRGHHAWQMLQQHFIDVDHNQILRNVGSPRRKKLCPVCECELRERVDDEIRCLNCHNKIEK